MLLLLSRSVVSDSLRPRGLQHTRLPCLSLSPGVCSDSVIPSKHLIRCSPLPLLPSIFPSIRAFSNEGESITIFLSLYQVTKALRASTSVLPMNRIFRVDSFRTDWFDLLAVQGTLESFLQLQFKSISSLAPSFLYGPALTSVHDYWNNLLFIHF